MPKQRINVCVDLDKWLWARTNQINVSQICNMALSTMMNDHENGNIEELMQDNKELEEKIKELLMKKSENIARIAAINSQKEEEWKQALERSGDIVESGILRSIE